jgi:glucokinase
VPRIARASELITGDNSATGEVWLFKNPLSPHSFIEESISIRALGDAVATAVTMIDGVVVIGGGLSNAWELFAPAMLQSVRQKLHSLDGKKSVERLEVEAFDVEDNSG